MNSKNVLQKILTLLSDKEVKFTEAQTKDGTILESPTFDLNEKVEVVAEDGTKTPAPDGTHELALKDSEGNETLIKVIAKDGKIVERENVELADVKVEPIPQASGKEEKVNERPEQPGSVTSGTQKMAEETEEAMPIPADEDKSMEEEGEKEVEINLGKKMEDMAYRIEEMEKKMMKMEETMMPPVDETVTEEVAMATEEDEEELPKLDGAPIEEQKFAAAETNRKNYGKKSKDAQSNFLSKLYK